MDERFECFGVRPKALVFRFYSDGALAAGMPLVPQIAAFDLAFVTRRAYEHGYRMMEAYSPFPVEGLAEALGFDYLTISDHIMVPRNLQSKYPYTGTGEFPAGASAAWLEQLTTTAYVAALTKKLRFVLSVMVVPHRPAVLAAKQLATIDVLSGGRLSRLF